MRASSSLRTLALLAISALPLFSAESAPGLPTSQPKLLTIEREFVKAGRRADHARNEAGWPAAMEKAKSPEYYVALTSMSGASEAWYLIPHESHAAVAAAMKHDDKNPELSAELERLAARDAEFVDRVQTIQAKARLDLSFGKFPDVAKIRFYEITLYSVKPGHNGDFDEIAKAYGAARGRVAPNSSYRVYEVIAGMPDTTYIVMSSVEDYGDFDGAMADHDKTMAAANAEEQKWFGKYGDTVSKAETNRYRLDPGQSYVPQETRAKDPEFWKSK
jgi:hypothetical protein